MWVMTTDGFVSVVDDVSKEGQNQGYLLVRARQRKTLELMLAEAGLKGKRILDTPERDYRYRVSITAKDFADWLAGRVYQIDYSNFKAEVERKYGDNVYHKALNRVWAVMRSLTPAPRNRKASKLDKV